MNIKLFILISILVHLVGGVGIYFYYNPPQGEAFYRVFPFLKKDLQEQLKEPLVSLEEVKKAENGKKTEEAKEVKTKPPLKSKKPSPAPVKTSFKKPIPEEPEPDKPVVSVKKNLPPLKEPTPSQKQPEIELIDAEKLKVEDSEQVLQEAPPQEEVEKNPEVLEESDSKTEEALKEEESLKNQEDAESESDSDFVFKSFFELNQQDGNPSLEYPESARKNNLEGEAIVIYYVTPSGLVESIQLEKTSGHPELDNFVLRTLARYRFLPDQEGWIRHPVKFILRGKEQEEDLKLRE